MNKPLNRLQKKIVSSVKKGEAEITRLEFEDGRTQTAVWWMNGDPVQNITDKTFQSVAIPLGECEEYTETTYSNWRTYGKN